MTVGILALQGAFEEHSQILTSLGIDSRLVRTKEELDNVDALIVPGGESTSMIRVMEGTNLTEPLRQFILTKPVLGTCAGIILFAKEVNPTQFSFKVLDISVNRNAYGSQLASFSDTLTLDIGTTARGMFIRAPQITEILSEDVEIIVKHNGKPVGVQQGNIIGLTFHPELVGETWFHERLVEMITH